MSESASLAAGNVSLASPVRSTLTLVLRAAALGAAVLLSALLGIALSNEHALLAALWPANGLALAVLLRAAPAMWPSYMLACLVGHMAAALLVGIDLWAAVFFAAGNGLEVYAGLLLIKRYCTLSGAMNVTHQTLRGALLVGAGAPLLSALPSTAVLCVGYDFDCWTALSTWWLGHALGMMIVIPLALMWSRPRLQAFLRLRSPGESIGLLMLAVAVTSLAFVQPAFLPIFLVPPMLLWAAFWLDLFGCVWAGCLVAAVALGFSMCGFGPLPAFTANDPSKMVLFLQLFIAAAVSPALLVRVILEERARVEASLRVSEQRLREANQELADALRVKDEFLATMSHELRTPLHAIIGWAEFLQSGLQGPLGEKQQRRVQLIYDSGQHLLALINDILDVARADMGEMVLEFEMLDVKTLCSTSLQLVQPAAKAKQQHLTCKLGRAPRTIWGDQRRLKQILINLLDNAVKFTPPQGHIELQVEGDAPAQRVRFRVCDDGDGIAAADQERLFQPFVQLDGYARRHHSGAGLGLYLVHRLSALHKGSVTLQSEPGRGSCFTVSLPWRGGSPPKKLELTRPRR